MNKIYETKQSILLKVTNKTLLPENTYILVNDQARKIHFDPLLTGDELGTVSQECSSHFINAAYNIGLLNSVTPAASFQLLLLSGGIYYRIQQAFYSTFGATLPTGFLGIKRVFVNDIPLAMLDYENFEALPQSNITIIGDTIGTGATLDKALSYYFKKTRELKVNVKKIIIFSIAGALPGARRLKAFEDEYLKPAGIELHVFFSQAIFGLAENNIDMLYFHKDSVLPDGVRENITSSRQRFIAQYMCAIWDWGERNNSPDIHLRNVIRVCESYEKSLHDEVYLEELREMRALALNKIDARSADLKF